MNAVIVATAVTAAVGFATGVSAAVDFEIVETAVIVATTGEIAIRGPRATMFLPARVRSDPNVDGPYPDSPPLLPSSQDLSVFRCQCAEDRLQGREAPAAICFRARQDRAKPHHGSVSQEAA